MKTKILSGLSLFLLSLMMFTGCQNGNINEYRLGERFTLNPGQTAVIEPEGLRVKFEKILNDSRCPGDTICIWQGQVQSLLTISVDGEGEQLTLTQSGSEPAAFQTYHQFYFEFSITPYPESEEPLLLSDYRLNLKITRLG